MQLHSGGQQKAAAIDCYEKAVDRFGMGWIVSICMDHISFVSCFKVWNSALKIVC